MNLQLSLYKTSKRRYNQAIKEKEGFMDQTAFKAALSETFGRLSLSLLLGEEEKDKFYHLYRRLVEENEKYNLTAIKDIDKIILLHYVDSLTAEALFPVGASVIDVGCGAGFPSVPLAICRPDLKITAMDSTAKKVNYVSMVSSELSLGINAVCARAEEIAKADADDSLRECFDCATARAVADLTVLSELCLPMVKRGGAFIVMKGKNGLSEIDNAKKAIYTLGGKIEDLSEFALKDKDGELYERVSAKIVKVGKTPKEYPRAFAQIRKKPIS
jgi:16S rRNA (guanine527-N7)-methyltransferase